MQAIDCPTAAHLSEFSCGNLSTERFEAIADHLNSCTACQSKLLVVDTPADPWVAAVREALLTDAEKEDPQWPTALVRIEAAVREAVASATPPTAADEEAADLCFLEPARAAR